MTGRADDAAALRATGPCPICGADAREAMPGGPSGAMLSDGRVVDRPLNKTSCGMCGCVSHAVTPDSGAVSAWYAQNYMLSTASPKADTARAAAYCRWITRVLERTDFGAVLEIGSGSGALLHALSVALPGAKSLVGCEPSHGTPSSGRLDFYRGTIDAVPQDRRFDLVVAVNVLEHVANPMQFLRKARDRLRGGGEIVVVCPDADVPNLELLFLDHLFSYTRAGLDHLARRAGLAILAEHKAPADIGDFRMYRLSQRPPGFADRGAGSPASLLAARRDYIRRWAGLDAVLLQRLAAGRATAFGGGQMAALLRAYAPGTWNLLDSIEIDEPADAWQLGKDVAKYEPGRAAGRRYLLAVAPAVQDRLAARIVQDGAYPAGFSDIIER
jgi:SAM-dependent methyltransferase